MSHLLWKYYWENDVDKFRRQLASGHTLQHSRSSGAGVGSPGTFGSSPRTITKSRKTSGPVTNIANPKNTGYTLGKSDMNSRDHVGLTLLLRAASSTSHTAKFFVQALLDHPAIDMYIQDAESGWNALHRALYNGNISIARLLLEKERRDLTESLGNAVAKVGQLIKTKDHEGNSPFDVYNATIALRSLKTSVGYVSQDNESDDEEDSGREDTRLVGTLSDSYSQLLIDFLIDNITGTLALAKKSLPLEVTRTSRSGLGMKMTDSTPSVSIYNVRST